MEYQEIINFLDDTTNQPSELRTKNWVEINEESRRTYNFKCIKRINLKLER